MRSRQIHRLLTAAAGLLLLLQAGLLAVLWMLPPPPTELPEVEKPEKRKALAEAEPPAAQDSVAVRTLDHLLDQRVTDAAARLGQDPAPLLPSDAMRDAAATARSPSDPAVRALVDHYSASLATLGETLDATSSPETAAAPGTPDPGAGSPRAPTPPAP